MRSASSVQSVSFSLFGDQACACAQDPTGYASAVDMMRRLRGPLTVSWDLTMDCHLRCAHCFNMSGSHRHPDELTHAEAMALCRQLIDLEVLNVCLCGGEPLLRADLFEIAETLGAADIVLSMVTNGYYLTEEKARRLEAAGVRFIQVSIDGVDAETHERLRGLSGSFERALAAARAVAKTKVELAVAFCPTRFNIEQFPDYVRMVRELGAKQIRMMPILRMGRAELFRDELLPTADQLVRFRQHVQEASLTAMDDGVMIELGDPLEHFYLFPRNDAKLFILCIRSNGDLTITGYLPLVFGNVRERPIMDYWNAGLADIWRHPLVTSLCDRVTNLEELRDIDPLPWVEGDLHVDLFDPRATLEHPSVKKIMKPTPKPEGFKIRSEHDDVMSVFPLDFDCGRQVHFLNPNATFIYRQCDGKRSVAEIARALMKEYPDLPKEQARRDVEACLFALADLGLVEWKKNGRTPPPKAGLLVRFSDETDFKPISSFLSDCIAEQREGRGLPNWYLPVDVAGYYHPVAVRMRQFHSKEICYVLERAGKLLGVGSLTFVAAPLTSSQIGCLAVRGDSAAEHRDLSSILLDGLCRAGRHLGLTKLKCSLLGDEPAAPLARFLSEHGFACEAVLRDELGPGGHYSVYSKPLPRSEEKP
ncbi:radical SAM protein [bacterium]|nr:radical SAM protein [bacterium]